MFELAQAGGGINTLTGRKEKVDGENTWGVLIGFSCKTASGLATDKETAESCIEEEAGTTGQTFFAVRLIAQTIKPLWLFLENVTGLLKGQQWLLVVRKLRSHGYAVAVLHSTPTRSGLPHNRNRLWFLALRKDLLDMAHMTEDEFIKRVEALDNILHQGHRQMSLDSMLLSECDPVVCARRLHLMQQLDDGVIDGSTGSSGAPMSGEVSLALKERREKGAVASSFWRSADAHRYPEFLILPEREKSMLDSAQCQFPETARDRLQRISNISQNAMSTGIGNWPCVTPQGTFWLHNRARLAVGLEAMRAQGIWLSPQQEQMYSSKFLFDLAGNAFNTWCCSSKLFIGALQ